MEQQLRHVAVILLTLLCVAACENYSLATTTGGEVVRLNRLNGAVALVQERGLVPLQEIEDQTGATPVTAWPVITFGQFGGIRAEVRTRWRDGKVLYRLTVQSDSTQAPAKARVMAGSWMWRVQSWTLNFVDSTGFKAFDLTVPTNTMTKIQNDSGTTLYYDINDAQPVSRSDYRAAKRIDIQWRSS